MPEIIPGFDPETAKKKMAKFQDINPKVEKLSRFFRLAA
jgi:hypothetical protein